MTFRATLITLCTMLSAAAYARADAPRRVDIPAGELSVALLKLTQQYGAELVYRPEQVYGLRTRGAHGSFTTEQAVTQLLQGTVLELRTDQSGAMLISPPASASAQSSGSAPQASAASPQDASDASKEGKKGSSPDFRVAQVDQGKASRTTSIREKSAGEQSESPSPGLSEIVVTAQKRPERLQDVPVPVTAISAQTLLANNQTQLRDYFSSIPGLSLTPSGGTAAIQTLAIRGITTGANQNPTVGITVDDVPFGASTAGGSGGGLIPDIDPADLARVEVLRGPQGTLYGASSMGGLLKYVTVDPSMDGLSGHVMAGGESIHNGSGLGYSGSGAVNVPLGEELAVRVSGFTRRTPGYVDNVDTGRRGVNEEEVNGGRLSVLWKPSESFSAKAGALIQETQWDGSSSVFLAPGFGDLQQSYVPGTGAQNTRLQSYSLVLAGKAGGVDLTSVTGYNTNSYFSAADVTSALGTGAAFTNDNKTDKFTQEIRLSTALGSNVDWLLGAFYTHENSRFNQGFVALDTTTGAGLGSLLAASSPTSYREYAAFTDLTWKVTNTFDVQFGGRESHIKQETLESTSQGVFVGGGVVVTPAAESTANVFTYLVTPRLKISPDVMVYARLASGYRAGGPNVNSVLSGAPPTYSPDKTQNYELGAKGDFVDHKLSVDASLYYIDWRDIQLQLINPVTHLGYTGNGNKAKSQGVELSVESKPLTGLSLAAWVAFADASLTQALPSTSTVVGAAGDRLPLSSRFSGNVSLEQSFPLRSDVTGFVGGSVSYVGNREGAFEATSLRQAYPGYAEINLRAGVEYSAWTVNVSVNNVSDKRALLSGGMGAFPPVSFQIIQPRTVGISVLRSF